MPPIQSSSCCLFTICFTELPQKRVVKCESDIKIEIRFEHQNWLSNAIRLCLRVIDLGEATFCDASLMLETLPQVLKCYGSWMLFNKLLAYYTKQLESVTTSNLFTFSSRTHTIQSEAKKNDFRLLIGSSACMKEYEFFLKSKLKWSHF